MGNKLRLPFINVKHKAHVWVVDYFPHDFKEFTEQVHRVDGKTTWRWKFQLQVCDADLNKDEIKKEGLKPEQVIALFVRGEEADKLLGLQAHDLNTKRGETTIKKLQEKLFILWGDLAEQKEKYLLANPKIKADRTFSFMTRLLYINNRPFEAGVREFGVEDKSGVLERDRWSKYWEIFDTKIV
jgi:protection-of-telomeres protein 1